MTLDRQECSETENSQLKEQLGFLFRFLFYKWAIAPFL